MHTCAYVFVWILFIRAQISSRKCFTLMRQIQHHLNKSHPVTSQAEPKNIKLKQKIKKSSNNASHQIKTKKFLDNYRVEF